MDSTPSKAQPRHELYRQLTRVGRDTPMGRYLRCFWYPVALVAELKREPVKAVTLLGEKLALFQTEEGAYGLVAQRCPHRGTSLACGMAEAGGIRCAYHGWKFSVDGRCLDQPTEHHASTMKNEIRIAARSSANSCRKARAQCTPGPRSRTSSTPGSERTRAPCPARQCAAVRGYEIE